MMRVTSFSVLQYEKSEEGGKKTAISMLNPDPVMYESNVINGP